MDKFILKSDGGIFLGYSSSNKAYKVYNNKTLYLEESMHVTFEETQNDEILDDINESIQHLSLNDKTHMKDKNKNMNKDLLSTNN